MTTRKKTPIVADPATKTRKPRSKPENPDTSAAKAPETVAAAETIPAKKPRARAKAAPKKPAKAKPKANLVPAKQDNALVVPEEPTVSENAQESTIDHENEAMKSAFSALPHRFQVFVEAYVATLNATEAAIRAGYGVTGAGARGHILISRPDLKPIIDWMIANDIRELGLTKERVRAKIEAMANADTNELVELRRVCCRYCHNDEHVYMETPAEYRKRKADYDNEMARAEANGLAPALHPVWDDTIIVGFNGLLEPDPKCPECFGIGAERLIYKDTRYLSPEGRAIYAGAHWGKDGLVVKSYSAENAIERLAKIEKLYDDKTEININVVPTHELDAIYDEAMQRSRAQSSKVIGRSGRIEDIENQE